MKKAIYYVAPFVMLPIFFWFFIWLGDTNIIKPNVLITLTYILFFLFSALMGSLSCSDKKFDYRMTAIVPVSLFVALFTGLFFDEGCDGNAQLSIHHALNMAYYCSWLPIAIGMMITTFVFSFKPIRVSKWFGHKVSGE